MFFFSGVPNVENEEGKDQIGQDVEDQGRVDSHEGGDQASAGGAAIGGLRRDPGQDSYVSEFER